MSHSDSHSLLRRREEGIATVSFSELLFDLIYVFAVTQLSHYFLHHLNLLGFLQGAVLWLAVWMGWQHTVWMTNWFDPNIRSVRGILFVLMLLGLILASALPEAFGERGILFAILYVTIQIGRTISILVMLGRKHQLTPNYTRILGWFIISAVFWIIGGLEDGNTRLILWAIAVLSDYVSPMFGFYLPFLGRSNSATDWTIDGHHLAERSQLFVIIAFGETILMSGASLSEIETWTTSVVLAASISFISSLAMWWVYFDKSSEAGSEKIKKTSNPGLLGLKFHSVHVILVGALIICAVGDESVVSHPHEHVTKSAIFVLIIGPIIYLLANMVYKWFTYEVIVKSHIVAITALVILIPLSSFMNLLVLNALGVTIFVLTCFYEIIEQRRNKKVNISE